jgi:hypothetical protein
MIYCKNFCKYYNVLPPSTKKEKKKVPGGFEVENVLFNSIFFTLGNTKEMLLIPSSPNPPPKKEPLLERLTVRWALVADSCNPSYLGG